MYAFATAEVPADGVDAPCNNCGTAYHLTRVYDPNASPETLRPLQPTVLGQPKHDDSSIGAALAPDLHHDEATTPDGAMVRGMSEPGFIDAAFREQRLSDARVSEPHFEEPELGDFANTKMADEPFLASEPFTAEPLKAQLAHSEPWPDQPAVKPVLMANDESTVVSAKPEDADIVAEIRDEPATSGKSTGAKAPDEIVAKKEDLPPRVEISREPSGALLPGLAKDEPEFGDLATLDGIADKEPIRTRAIVPMASERTLARRCSASWGGPPVGDPQALMQSRVRKSGDTKRPGGESREGKSVVRLSMTKM